MKTKYLSVLVAVFMIAGAGFIIADDVDADPATTYGSFNIYINHGTTWSTAYSVQGYDAAIALTNYATANNVDITIDSNTFTESYGYKNINVNYGTVSKIGNSTANDVSKWNVIYFPATGSAWAVGPNNALGLYKPFGDYNETYRTANIAMYYGTAAAAAEAVSGLPTTGLKSVVLLTQIQNNADFAVTFTIKVASQSVLDHVRAKNGMQVTSTLSTVNESTLLAGVTLTGYGSDLYLALKNAVGTNISAVEEVPGHDNGSYLTNYSWVNEFFGLSTLLLDDQDDDDWSNDIYAYWTQYTVYVGEDNAGNEKSDFVLGYYSPLNEAPNTQKTYTIVFSEGTA